MINNNGWQYGSLHGLFTDVYIPIFIVLLVLGVIGYIVH